MVALEDEKKPPTELLAVSDPVDPRDSMVPSANFMYSPLALLPRSITEPTGTLLLLLTVPTTGTHVEPFLDEVWAGSGASFANSLLVVTFSPVEYVAANADCQAANGDQCGVQHVGQLLVAVEEDVVLAALSALDRQ